LLVFFIWIDYYGFVAAPTHGSSTKDLCVLMVLPKEHKRGAATFFF